MVAIVSAGISRFGKRSESIFDIAAESSLPVLRKHRNDVDFVIVSNAYSGEFNGISGLNSLLTSYLSLDKIPSLKVDNTSSSGGTSALVAKSLLESGMADSVLVCGVEKMTEKPTREVAGIIASLLPERERSAGPSLPSLAGLLAKLYMKRYSPKREAIAEVSVKNRANGALNPISHIQKVLTLEQVMESKVIVDPLRLYEFCPVSDGSASILLVRDEDAASYGTKPIYIRGAAIASDTSHITDREDLLRINSVARSGREAMKQAAIDRPDFAELHDMASILEIVQAELLGFFHEGEGWKAMESGRTEIGGDLPINTSGGLMARGHPIGASGIAQIYETYLQLRNEAGNRQVRNAETGLTLGMAGFGNSATSFVLGVSP